MWRASDGADPTTTCLAFFPGKNTVSQPFANRALNSICEYRFVFPLSLLKHLGGMVASERRALDLLLPQWSFSRS